MQIPERFWSPAPQLLNTDVPYWNIYHNPEHEAVLPCRKCWGSLGENCRHGVLFFFHAAGNKSWSSLIFLGSAQNKMLRTLPYSSSRSQVWASSLHLLISFRPALSVEAVVCQTFLKCERNPQKPNRTHTGRSCKLCTEKSQFGNWTHSLPSVRW